MTSHPASHVFANAPALMSPYTPPSRSRSRVHAHLVPLASACRRKRVKVEFGCVIYSTLGEDGLAEDDHKKQGNNSGGFPGHSYPPCLSIEEHLYDSRLDSPREFGLIHRLHRQRRFPRPGNPGLQNRKVYSQVPPAFFCLFGSLLFCVICVICGSSS